MLGSGPKILSRFEDPSSRGPTVGKSFGRPCMKNTWPKQLEAAKAALLSTNNKAIVHLVFRDLLGEDVGPVSVIWGLPEPRKILHKPQSDGSWAGQAKNIRYFPEKHADLVATFKSFRILVERYRFDRNSEAIEKAAEYLFIFQSPEGDIRGFIGNQYTTYYTGYILSLLIQAGYADDPRVDRGTRWLIVMRQDDGGWTVPLLTHHFDGKTTYRLTSSYAEPVDPDRKMPFSHNWTDMVLRAFAAHPVYRRSKEARLAYNDDKLIKY